MVITRHVKKHQMQSDETLSKTYSPPDISFEKNESGSVSVRGKDMSACLIYKYSLYFLVFLFGLGWLNNFMIYSLLT